MTRTSSCHLLDILATLPDPRKEKGKRHPLGAILGLLVVGLMCGQGSYTAIAVWGRTHRPLTKALGFRHPTSPCAATFHNLLKRLDVVRLEQLLMKWIAGVFQATPTLHSRLTAVAIDGKSLRGSGIRERRPTHLLAAVSHELGIPLAECAVSEKTNEVPVSTQLLKMFDISGKVITTDALLTQRTFCQDLLDRDAAYVLPVKANQKQVFEDIKHLFHPFSETDTEAIEDRRFQTLHTQANAHLDEHTTDDTKRGSLTTRTLRASTLLNEHLNWPGLAQVYEYHTHREQLATGKITHHTQYGITSLTPEKATAKDLLNLRKGHWTIENKLHWTRDVIFGEDASQVRTEAIPHVMAALRNTVLAVFRFNGHTKITHALRFFAEKPKLAVKLIQSGFLKLNGSVERPL